MNNPGLFDDDTIPDDDYIGVENDEEELGVDYMSMEDTPNETNDSIPLEHHEEEREQPTRKRAKIKKMSPGLLRKFPQVASMLITRIDGKQVLFINPKHYR